LVGHRLRLGTELVGHRLRPPESSGIDANFGRRAFSNPIPRVLTHAGQYDDIALLHQTQTGKRQRPLFNAPLFNASSQSVDAFVTRNDQNIGTACSEQPHGHHTNDLIDVPFQPDRVTNREVMHIENVISVVSGAVLTPYGPSTEIR
jgi:hypothetical protein